MQSCAVIATDWHIGVTRAKPGTLVASTRAKISAKWLMNRNTAPRVALARASVKRLHAIGQVTAQVRRRPIPERRARAGREARIKTELHLPYSRPPL